MLYLIIAYEYEEIGAGATRKLYGVFTERSLAEEAVQQQQFKSSTRFKIEYVTENVLLQEPLL